MFRKFFIASILFSVVALFTPALFAENQSIEFTLTSPAQVAHKVLQPGTYFIRPVDASLLNAVEVSRANGKGVGFFLVHPETQLSPATQSTIELDRQANGIPRLTSFIVSGAETGYDFSGGSAKTLPALARLEHAIRHHV